MAHDDKWIFLELRALAAHRATAATTHATITNGGGTADSGSAHARPQPPPFQTASLRDANIPWHIEQQLRRTTCSFIEDLAALVEIPDAPAVAAQLFVQRFFVLHSFSTHDRFLVATAALFLAAKTEEFPIKVRLLTECALFLLLCRPPTKDELLKKSRSRQQVQSQPQTPQTPQPQSQTTGHQPLAHHTTGTKRLGAGGRPVEMSASLGNNPRAANAKHLDCLHALLEVVDVGEVETTAAKVLLLERVLLQTLAFDIAVPQPFAYVARLMDRVFALEAVDAAAPFSDVRGVVFLLLADAVKSGLSLAFNAVELAAGAVYLACLYRETISPNVATETNAPWWTVLGLSTHQLEAVSSGLLWLYEDHATGTALPGLGADLQKLWRVYRPEQNKPDLAFVKALDAELQRAQ